MSDLSPKPPQALLEAVARDLKPVKPSSSPARLITIATAIALLISSAIVVVLGIRGDASQLGPYITWGVSLAQFTAGLALLWAAMREGNPGARLPRGVIFGAGILVMLAIVGIAMLTFRSDAPPVPTRLAWIFGISCGGGGAIAASLLVLLFSWVFRSSLAIQPTLTGALFGAAAGVAVNAGWRLSCPATGLAHVLGAHGGAILFAVGFGALTGRLTGPRRLRKP